MNMYCLWADKTALMDADSKVHEISATQAISIFDAVSRLCFIDFQASMKSSWLQI